MLIDISTKAGYDMASALRGPDDSELFIFKSAFVAPFRELVGANTDNGIQGWAFWVDAKYAAMKMQDLRDSGLYFQALSHWESHMKRGYAALSGVGRPGIAEVSSRMISMLDATHNSVGAMQAIFAAQTEWLEQHGYLDQARSDRMVADMIARQ